MPRSWRAGAGALVLAVVPAACSAGDDGSQGSTTRPVVPVETSAPPTASTAPIVAETSATAAPTSATPEPTSSTPTSTATSSSTHSEPDIDLEATLNDFVGDGPGGAVALVRVGATVTIGAAGTADATGTPMRTDQPMRVGSLAKPFVAVLVLQLVDEGLVDLNATLGTYLTDTPIGAEVTITELLSHRSGIPNIVEQPAMLADAFADPTRVFTPAEMIAYVVDVEPGPRGQHSYSNTNYLLLGQLVEAIDGVDINESLRRRVTGPLGLTDTWFETVDRPAPADVAAGWGAGVFQGDRSTPYASVATGAWAAGALISTAEDLAAFLDALFDGELMSDESLAAMTDTGPNDYGLGISARLSGGGRGLAHRGSIIGYYATMGITSDGDTMLVIAVNADHLDAEALATQIALLLPR